MAWPSFGKSGFDENFQPIDLSLIIKMTSGAFFSLVLAIGGIMMIVGNINATKDVEKAD